MKPPVETVRVNRQGRDQLIKLKRLSGIEHWNSLCRLALAVSLKESSAPPAMTHADYDGGVEMTWKIFAGDYSDIMSLCLYARAQRDGLSATPDHAALTLRAHLHRGLGYLVADRNLKSVSELCVALFDSTEKVQNVNSLPKTC